MVEINDIRFDWKQKSFLSVILFMLLIQLTFAQETCLNTCALSEDYSGWIKIIATVLFAVVALLSSIYMIGRATGRRDWEAMAKTELYQTGIAAIWVIIIASVATTSCSVACLLTGEDNPILASTSYLSSLRSVMDGGISQLFDIARNVRVKSAIMLSIVGVIVRPWSGCDVVANSYEQMATLMSPFIASIIAQQYVLSFIGTFAFQFLLPMGIILRLIPFVRESGAALMALSFALYIVFPLTYVMADKMTAGIRPEAMVFREAGRECVAPQIAFDNLTMLGKFLPQAVFFPALSTIITIAAAKTLTKIFRYDFQEIIGHQ